MGCGPSSARLDRYPLRAGWLQGPFAAEAACSSIVSTGQALKLAVDLSAGTTMGGWMKKYHAYDITAPLARLVAEAPGASHVAAQQDAETEGVALGELVLGRIELAAQGGRTSRWVVRDNARSLAVLLELTARNGRSECEIYTCKPRFDGQVAASLPQASSLTTQPLYSWALVTVKLSADSKCGWHVQFAEGAAFDKAEAFSGLQSKFREDVAAKDWQASPVLIFSSGQSREPPLAHAVYIEDVDDQQFTQRLVQVAVGVDPMLFACLAATEAWLVDPILGESEM